MKKYFGSLSFYKQALMIGVPVMLQSLIQSLVSLVDNFMVAGLGDVKMSGVSVAGQILFVFMVLSNAICAAGGIYMTQFSGAKNSADMRLMGFMGIPFCISVVLATSMREIGQVRAPLVISVIGTLVNCALN